MRPGPAARILPSWGFSLAVSGRTIPLLVVSSRGVGWTTTRSPSGRSLVDTAVAVANVHSSCDGRLWPSGMNFGHRPDPCWSGGRATSLTDVGHRVEPLVDPLAGI